MSSVSPITATQAETFIENILNDTGLMQNGQISTEFRQFLENVLNGTLSSSTSASTTGTPTAASIASAPGATLPDGTPAYLDSMLGFDLTRMQSAAYSPKYAFANLAQYLAPTQANLDTIANTLGPSDGFIDTDGLSYILSDSEGYIGVRDGANGAPVWQWFAYNSAHPDPNATVSQTGNG
jgi:hypothetical protein